MDNLKIMPKKIIKNREKMKIIMTGAKKKWMKLTRNTYTRRTKAIDYGILVNKLHQKID